MRVEVATLFEPVSARREQTMNAIRATTGGVPPTATQLPLSKVLKALEHVERYLAELYEWFAQVFAKNQQAHGIFAALAQEERGHEELVRLETRLAADQMEKPVCVDVQELRDILSDVDRFRADKPRPTVKEAVAFSLDLESRAAEKHYRTTTVAELSPSLAKLIQRLAAADHKHLEVLRTSDWG
jgi:hypothetical protein